MNLTAHFQATIYTIRIFEEGRSYEDTNPYIAVCTAQIVGKDAYVSGFLGDMTPEVHRLLRSGLRERGIERAFYYRQNGGWREVVLSPQPKLK